MTPQRARAILAVAPDATRHEIDAAFRRAIRVAHPDRGGHADRVQLLLDARSRLQQPTAADTTGPAPLLVVPAPTWRDLLVSLVERLRHRPHRPPPRVR